MTPKTIGLSPALYEYVLSYGVREPEALQALREETASHPLVRMQISPDQGALMAMLVKLMGARRCLEVGVFTGYSALAVALALPEDGRLIACDISAEYTTVALRHWQRAGVARKIELRLGAALDTLDALIESSAGAALDTFDLAFIDADKENYPGYYERCLRLLRPGGLVLIDNVLWSGAVIDPGDREPSTAALRAFNIAVRQDERVDLVMLPVADGLTLARKR